MRLSVALVAMTNKNRLAHSEMSTELKIKAFTFCTGLLAAFHFLNKLILHKTCEGSAEHNNKVVSIEECNTY